MTIMVVGSFFVEVNIIKCEMAKFKKELLSKKSRYFKDARVIFDLAY